MFDALLGRFRARPNNEFFDSTLVSVMIAADKSSVGIGVLHATPHHCTEVAKDENETEYLKLWVEVIEPEVGRGEVVEPTHNQYIYDVDEADRGKDVVVMMKIE